MNFPKSTDLADEVTALRVENRELRRMISNLADKVEYLEDSLDGIVASLDNEPSIPWEDALRQLECPTQSK